MRTGQKMSTTARIIQQCIKCRMYNLPEGKRSRTRMKLIDAAAAVIGEKGFDRASLEEIAARAGMTRGAVYGNFKNKDELFLALIATVWKPIMPPLKPGASLKRQMRILGKAVASELVKVIPASDLPMPAERFVCVLDTMVTGLLFTYFQTPDLITEDIFISAFEALA